MIIYMEQTLMWLAREKPELVQSLPLEVVVADSEEFRYFKLREIK